jgi:hypothetical protein
MKPDGHLLYFPGKQFLFAQIMLRDQTVLIIRQTGCTLINRSLSTGISGFFLDKLSDRLVLNFGGFFGILILFLLDISALTQINPPPGNRL